MKKLPLWQWGLLCIVGGLAAGALMAFLPGRQVPTDRAEATAQAVGQVCAQLFFVVVGVALIVVDVVRRKRRRR